MKTRIKTRRSLPLTTEAVMSVALGVEKSYPGIRKLIAAVLERTDGLRASGRTTLPDELLAEARVEFGSVAAAVNALVVSLAWGHLGRMAPQTDSWTAMEEIGVRIFGHESGAEVVIDFGPG